MNSNPPIPLVEAVELNEEAIARALASYRGNENWWPRRIKEARFIIKSLSGKRG